MSNPLDTKIISRLAEILDKTNLTELEYEDEGCRISLVRNPAGVAVAGAYAPVQAPIAPGRRSGAGSGCCGGLRRCGRYRLH